MLLMFGKCPFLVRWKNVLSVSHPLHLRFSRNKFVTRTLISVNRPFFMRYISGKLAFFPLHFLYSCGHCLASMPHIPIARASSGRGDKFCHWITKFCKFCPFALCYISVPRCDQAFTWMLISNIKTNIKYSNRSYWAINVTKYYLAKSAT